LIVNVAAIMDIIAGLILLTGVIPLIPVVGKDIGKVTKWMAVHQVPIGIVAVIVGGLGLLDLTSGGIIASLVAIVAGIVLAIRVFGALPLVGEDLKKVVRAISSVQVTFGIIVLVVGILALI
jgi:hypothetical protein